MTVTVVVGNPNPQSRTRDAGELLAGALSGAPADNVLELCELGTRLLSWGDPTVADAVDLVGRSTLVVFATPTFKATYSGLLKLFLDQIEGGRGLAGVIAVPLMLGAGPAHALAPETTLRPVLSELGATCTAGLYLLDSTYREDPAVKRYVERWSPTMRALRNSQPTVDAR